MIYSSNVEKSLGTRQTEHIFFNLGAVDKNNPASSLNFPRKLHKRDTVNPNKTRPQGSAPYISRHRSIANFSICHFARPVAIRRLNVLLAPSDVRRVSPRAGEDKDQRLERGKGEETAPGTARSAAQDQHSAAARSQVAP